jgi:Leucine Rich repeat
MRGTVWKSLVAVGFSLFAPVPARAQVYYVGTTESIECLVANADEVYIAKLERIGRAIPGRSDSINVEDLEKHEVTLVVEETLKEDLFASDGRESGEKPYPRMSREVPYPASVLAEWKKRGSRLLVAESRGAPNAYVNSNVSFITLIELAPDTLEELTEDMKLLRNPADVIRVAKETVRRMPVNVRRIQTFQLVVPQEIVRGTKLALAPEKPGELRVTVPADERLERRALEEIRSKDERRREEGVRALRYFKSEENIARMKALLNDPSFGYLTDPASHNRGVEVHRHDIRRAAYEALKCWGVQVPMPVIDEKIWDPDAVKHVFLYEPDLADGELKKLDRFKNLNGVTALGIPIRDEHLKLISGFPNLREVALDGGQVTDAGLKHLAALKDLHSLGLGSRTVTDAGMKEVAGFANLDQLYLEKTGVTDAGLAHLAALKKLMVLDLTGTRVTDAGLAHLAGLTNLRVLRLEDTQVTDAGLRDLAPLKTLTELDLRGTRVTDAGLEVLAGFTNLEKLALYKSKATDKGVAKLQKARPKLEIHF